MFKISKENLYFVLVSGLFASIFFLNKTPYLLTCSFIFVVVALTSNIITEFYGKLGHLFRAFILINILLAKFDLLLISSLLSLLLSHYAASKMLVGLKDMRFEIRNFLSLVTWSLIDSFIIAVSLLNKFSSDKVLTIFTKDFVYKVSYSFLASILLYTVLSLIKRENKYNIKFIGKKVISLSLKNKEI